MPRPSRRGPRARRAPERRPATWARTRTRAVRRRPHRKGGHGVWGRVRSGPARRRACVREGRVESAVHVVTCARERRCPPGKEGCTDGLPPHCGDRMRLSAAAALVAHVRRGGCGRCAPVPRVPRVLRAAGRGRQARPRKASAQQLSQLVRKLKLGNAIHAVPDFLGTDVRPQKYVFVENCAAVHSIFSKIERTFCPQSRGSDAQARRQPPQQPQETRQV